jgi:hypothetical protein
MNRDDFFAAASAANAIQVAGVTAGQEIARRELEPKIAELRDALAGLYGLLELLSGRDDVPPVMRWREWESNHRAVEARRLLADYEQHTKVTA